MKKVALFAVAAIIVASTFFGCAGPPVAPGKMKAESLSTDKRFRKYKSVDIRPFSTKDIIYGGVADKDNMDMFMKDANMYFINGFEGGMKKTHFKKSTAGSETCGELVIEGRFVEFDLGADGTATVIVDGVMIETKTGAVVARFGDTRTAQGTPGSTDSLKKVCRDMGNSISEFLGAVY